MLVVIFTRSAFQLVYCIKPKVAENDSGTSGVAGRAAGSFQWISPPCKTTSTTSSTFCPESGTCFVAIILTRPTRMPAVSGKRAAMSPREQPHAVFSGRALAARPPCRRQLLHTHVHTLTHTGTQPAQRSFTHANSMPLLTAGRGSTAVLLRTRRARGDNAPQWPWLTKLRCKRYSATQTDT